MLRYRELPQDRPLLMICRTGARSGQATAFLLANGWTDVVNVAGGTLAWERAGLPVRRGSPGARRGRPARAEALPRRCARAGGPAGARPSRGSCSGWAQAQPTRSRITKFTVPDAGRGEVAELLADLVVDLEGRDDGADEAELEERLLRARGSPGPSWPGCRPRSSRR